MISKMKKVLKAFEERDISTVTSLLTLGFVDPNALIADKGVSPFHLIIGNPSEKFAMKVTKLFLRHGGDPNIPSAEGVTPTHVAAAWGRTRILHLLLVNGADPWLQDDDRKNAFNYAFDEQAWEAVEMLHHFQRVHSAANAKRETHPRFHLELERVLLRSGEEVFAYVPEKSDRGRSDTEDNHISKKCNIETQTDTTSRTSSPIDVMELKDEPRWSKDFYQTSCHVTVHRDSHDELEKQNQRFVSSIHIEPEKVSISEPQSNKKSPSLNMSSSLFEEELREAVRKRFQRIQSGQNKSDLHSVSGIEPLEESFAEKPEVSREKVIELSGTYVSCIEEDSDCRIVLDDTPCKDQSSESFISLAEEYKYSDPDENVVLIEKKLIPALNISTIECDDELITDDASSVASSTSSFPSTLSYASDCLRYDLTRLGCNPGPITTTTKRLYLKKLWRLMKDRGKHWELKKSKDKRPIETVESANNQSKPVYPIELEKTFLRLLSLDEIKQSAAREEEMMQSFLRCNTKRKWREGNSQTSFNYLLLDSRVSLNLPKRASGLTTEQVWQCFISAVFYVGKGKQARPYAHLYQAAALWGKQQSTPIDSKVRRILDMWKDGVGVVCLHVFHNTIPVEAYTREAAMIDALALKNVENVRHGEYYGVASTWTDEDKLKLGVYLLYKSMMIFLSEGERQIRPFDIA